ncbi:MAG TPA: hypothetical protein DIW47_11605 [Bacteroidetes bacterium]|nr:hypothetical protein [Bacteroidota bacterium]
MIGFRIKIWKDFQILTKEFLPSKRPPSGGLILVGVVLLLQSFHPYGVLFAYEEKFVLQSYD